MPDTTSRSGQIPIVQAAKLLIIQGSGFSHQRRLSAGLLGKKYIGHCHVNQLEACSSMREACQPIEIVKVDRQRTTEFQS